MSVSVSNFFTRVAWDLHETDGTFATTEAWNASEMISYLNYSEKLFLEKTGILKQYTTIVAVGNSLSFPRPDNSIDIDRISSNGKQLHRQTSFDLMLEDRAWRSKTGGKLSYWHEDNLPNNRFEVNKMPAGGVTLRIVSDYLPSEYTAISGNINLKDCWEPYLRWKVVSLALAKDGDNQDIQRSEYADQRFKLGITIAKRILKGMAEINVRR